MKSPVTFLLSLFLGAFVSVTIAEEEKPNIILILCDDLGYADIGPFGSKNHRTPVLDRMAEEGRIFTDFYVTSGVCSPSRSSIMTGCYPKRVGIHKNEEDQWVLFPGNKTGLNPEEITMAEVLKEQGYATGMVGKWHLGDQPEFLPTNHGFDSYYGIPFSNDMGQTDRPKPYKYPPLPVLRNDRVIEKEPDQAYITQKYTREALGFITMNHHRPFFLYLPHTMPHWPQYSSPRFDGKSANGKWGDTVEEIDWSTGEIIKTLDDLGLAEKTLIVFFSDNGGATRHGASNTPLSGAKGTTMEGGQRVCFLAWWPGKIPAGTECTEMATSMDLLPTFAGLAGGSAPQDRGIDGKDIWPLFTGEPEAKSPHDAFYYYFRGNLDAVRSGDWKLRVANKGKAVETQLYNLEADIAEANNIAGQHPEKVTELLAMLDEARADLGDDAKGVAGKNVREPGFVEDAVPLTK